MDSSPSVLTNVEDREISHSLATLQVNGSERLPPRSSRSTDVLQDLFIEHTNANPRTDSASRQRVESISNPRIDSTCNNFESIVDINAADVDDSEFDSDAESEPNDRE